MFSTDYTPFFESVLFESLGKETQVDSYQVLSGGSINNALKISTKQGDFFLKWNESPQTEGMFAVEAKSLQLLADKQVFKIPNVINYGNNENKSYLLLEFVKSAHQKKIYWQNFGEQLAELHQHTNIQFGLHFNNFIGALPQSNEFFDTWIDFFIDRRLRVQSGLAYYNGLINKDLLLKFEYLYKKLPALLPTEKPSLLHGDLWSGNVMVGERGEPCLIDPAVYYGNREIEIAFTRLFGGFEDEFYEAYQSTFPLQTGFEERIEIYNLYPLLVHVNLFGTAYLSSVERVLNKFV
jgi:fructosamine-3-kinase